MTHLAWVPPAWLDAAARTLQGLAARHPSRTLLLVPLPEEPSRIDAHLSVRCYRAGDREICGEVIELHLCGDRARAPASIVVPLAIADLPVFLRWRGEPPFGAGELDELVELADRLIVDSSEWETLRYRELAELFARTAASDLVWARLHPWRLALAERWPEIGAQEILIAGPAAEVALLRGWLSTRLRRELPPGAAAARLEVQLDGGALTLPATPPPTPSDLLSAELDRSGRDRVYEEAVLGAVGAASADGAV